MLTPVGIDTRASDYTARFQVHDTLLSGLLWHVLLQGIFKLLLIFRLRGLLRGFNYESKEHRLYKDPKVSVL